MDQEKIKPIAYAVAGLVILALVATVSWSPIRNLFPKKTGLSPASQKSLKASLADENKSDEQKLQERVSAIVAGKDFGRCNEIQDEMYRKVCINNIALNLAQEKQDASYCQKMDGKLMSVADCESQVVPQKALEQQDVKICQEAETSEIQTACYENFWLDSALQKSDIKLCENLATSQEKDICFDRYLFQKEFFENSGDFQCNKFRQQQVQADCKTYQSNFSDAKFNPCQKLKSREFSAYCSMYR